MHYVAVYLPKLFINQLAFRNGTSINRKCQRKQHNIYHRIVQRNHNHIILDSRKTRTSTSSAHHVNTRTDPRTLYTPQKNQKRLIGSVAITLQRRTIITMRTNRLWNEFSIDVRKVIRQNPPIMQIRYIYSHTSGYLFILYFKLSARLIANLKFSKLYRNSESQLRTSGTTENDVYSA